MFASGLPAVHDDSMPEARVGPHLLNGSQKRSRIVFGNVFVLTTPRVAIRGWERRLAGAVLAPSTDESG